MKEMPKKANQLTRGVLKAATGMATSKPQDLVKLAAHTGNELLKKNFSKALYDTYAYLVNVGEIDEKYFKTEHFADLAPDFKRIEDSSFGQEKLDTLRRIFANLAKDSSNEAHKKYLLEMTLEMSEPEIRLLIAEHTVANKILNRVSDSGSNRLRSASEWTNELTNASNLKHEALVVSAEKGLVDKGLISGRILSDKSGVDYVKGKGRLSSLGIEMCELMLLSNDPLIKGKEQPK